MLLILLMTLGMALGADVPSSTNTYFTLADKAHMKKLVEPGFQLQDLAGAYHAVLGYNLIKEPIVKIAETCEFLIKEAGKTPLLPEQVYHIASTWKTLGKCQQKSLPLSALTKVLTSTLEKPDSTPKSIYHSLNSLVLLGQKISDSTKTKIAKTLEESLKKDGNLLNLGYIFHIAAELGPTGAFAFDHIEEVIAQADETDGQFLQFEGGLPVTSLVTNGIYKLASSLKKKLPLKYEQIVKLANYFLQRLSVKSPEGAVSLLSSIDIMANHPSEKPICITLSKNGAVISEEQPIVYVKVCDLFGNPVPSSSNLVANTATKVGDDVVVMSKKNFQVTSDKTIFGLNFMSISPEPGFYNIAVSGQVSNTVKVKVLTKIEVNFLEIGTADADQTTQPKLVEVSYPEKCNKKIEADFQQKLVIRFALKNASKNKSMRVHQAFVRLSSISSTEKDQQEIIFVAESDASNLYKFDMPVGTAAKNFGYHSGEYNVELIIGDALLKNSLKWTIATVSLKFPEPGTSEVAKASTYKQKPYVYAPKPEIQHMFREPEKRPPAFVSNLFTALCLSPLLILLILWVKVGINISNFPVSPSAILFHLGLGSIFTLFGVFWLKLNMFTTLQYLLGLGLVTFLSGNRLLSQIAHNRKSSR